MKCKQFKITVIIAVALILVLAILTNVQAEQENDGVTLWPAFQTLTVQKGETKQISVHIRNNNDTRLKVEANYQNITWGIDPNSSLTLDNSEAAPAAWFRAESEDPFLINAGETGEFVSTLTVPGDTKLEGYYAAILLKFSPETDESVFTTASEIASTIYLSITDTDGVGAVRTAEIIEFKPKKSLVFTAKNEFAVEVKNTGSLHFRPIGNIDIYDSRGEKQSYPAILNNDMIYLLPNQTLLEALAWEDETVSSFFPPIGKYKAVLKIYAEEAREYNLEEEVDFYVIPIQYMLLTGLLLGISAMILYPLAKRRKAKR